jgi:hypothetical protein
LTRSCASEPVGCGCSVRRRRCSRNVAGVGNCCSSASAPGRGALHKVAHRPPHAAGGAAAQREPRCRSVSQMAGSSEPSHPDARSRAGRTRPRGRGAARSCGRPRGTATRTCRCWRTRCTTPAAPRPSASARRDSRRGPRPARAFSTALYERAISGVMRSSCDVYQCMLLVMMPMDSFAAGTCCSAYSTTSRSHGMPCCGPGGVRRVCWL